MISGGGEELGRWRLRNPTVPLDEIVAQFVSFSLSGISPLVSEEAQRPTG